MRERFDALIVAGGAARRMGGIDKVALEVSGAALLDRVIASVGGAERIVCVGPTRPTAVTVQWTREEPIGGGPVPALKAGLDSVRASSTVVLAADMPFVTSNDIDALVAARGRADAAVALDASGMPQPLLAAYRTDAVRAALDGRHLRGMSMTEVIAGLQCVYVDRRDAAFDCDTWDDVAAARKGGP